MPHVDKYRSMCDLIDQRAEGKDYRIVCKERASPVVILAPHGGEIEPTTSKIAKEIAGANFSLYLFEGCMERDNFDVLHVTSTKYDEPKCVRLVGKSRLALAIHGLRHGNSVEVGGLNEELKAHSVRELRVAGFSAHSDPNSGHSGLDAANICNRAQEKGVQLEIPMKIRDCLRDNSGRLAEFAAALHKAIYATIKLPAS